MSSTLDFITLLSYAKVIGVNWCHTMISKFALLTPRQFKYLVKHMLAIQVFISQI